LEPIIITFYGRLGAEAAIAHTTWNSGGAGFLSRVDLPEQVKTRVKLLIGTTANT